MPTVRIELTAFRFLFMNVVLWDERSTYWAKRARIVFPCTIVNLLDYTKIIICLMRSKLYYVFQNNNLVVLHWKKLKYVICKFIEAYILMDLTIIITWICCCCNCLQCTNWYSTVDCSTRFLSTLMGEMGNYLYFRSIYNSNQLRQHQRDDL